MPVDPAAWRGRRVLVTGHTGFKGSWLCLWLASMGAEVVGASDAELPAPSLFDAARVREDVDHRLVDVRDRDGVAGLLAEVRPEVVLHLAAQPYVRRSYAEPVETYAANVMGTAHVLDAVRAVDTVRAVVVVTSDKCYDNPADRGPRPFTEDDPMGGHDPYSSSKGCAELVTAAFRRSFFAGDGAARVASGRAGNVIGGGDWGEDRLIPDMMRGALGGTPIAIRNPTSVRPWQHVLNPLSGYLVLAQALLEHAEVGDAYNFGPAADDAQPVEHIVRRLTELWPGELRWEIDPGPHPHEAGHLSLDSARAAAELGWRPIWALDEALRSICEWFAAFRDGTDVRDVTLRQVARFVESAA